MHHVMHLMGDVSRIPTGCGARRTAGAYAAGPCSGYPAQVIASAAGPSPRPPSPSPRDVTHPHFNRLFRGLMSLRRRSDRPADVMPHVWRCHCGPERTYSRSVHWLRPVEGRFVPVPATKSRLWLLCYGTQTPVHPLHCADVLRFGGACKGLPSAPPLPGSSTTPTCIVRRPGPRLRLGRQRRTRAGLSG